MGIMEKKGYILEKRKKLLNYIERREDMEKKNDEILDVVERGEVKIEIKKKYDIKEE